MNERYQALLSEFETSQKEIDGLLAKSDFSQEDDVKVNELLDAQMSRKEQLLRMQDMLKKHKEVEQLINTPATSMVFDNQKSAGAPRVLGMQNAGHTIIDNSKSEVMEIFGEGAGLISEKQASLIKSREYHIAFFDYVRRKGQLSLMDKTNVKALEEGSDPDGGYLVPSEVLRRIIQKTAAPTRIGERVTRLTTSRDALVIPKVVYATDDIYTTGMRVTYTGETPTSSTQHRVTQPSFGQIRIPIYTAMMSLPLTNDLVEDANFPLMSWVSDKFAETVRLHRDNIILNGTGVAQPKGIIPFVNTTDGVAHVLSGVANDIGADAIRGLPFDLPEQYINDNTAWIMNRSSAGKKVAQLKSTTNEYLFRRGYQDNGIALPVPDTLDGYGIIWSNFMPDVGDGAYPMLFGDLMGYYDVERIGFSVRLLGELYAETNQVVMLGRFRHGGDMAEPFRMKALKSDNA